MSPVTESMAAAPGLQHPHKARQPSIKYASATNAVVIGADLACDSCMYCGLQAFCIQEEALKSINLLSMCLQNFQQQQ